ncbi:hypothetical protein [Candidatus Nitrosocosmicus franklandus]|uniref:MEDS domain-containing protein n=1 Tax=Candidatus Nitrosocosmicus franklandianus TaxID=1798806 RepID=A0A484ICF5_9ARCH|nr:hypothetical protein [Candidatus Nitrosocosmicus franklandus]VFJ14405.1 conserved protein of unknown function [Candidatus Nitrosocosmicus franklandus]
MIYTNRVKGCFIIKQLANKIYDFVVDDAVEEIGNSKHGLHCLIVYPNLETFRVFYSKYIERQINKENEIILFCPFYETVGTARRNLSMKQIHTDELQYERDVSLIIFDSLDQYFGKMSVREFIGRLVEFSVEDKKKYGVSILSDMGCFFFKMRHRQLMDYEFSLPVQFDMPLKGLCVYNELDFDNRLSDEQKLDMVNHHGLSIRLQSV